MESYIYDLSLGICYGKNVTSMVLQIDHIICYLFMYNTYLWHFTLLCTVSSRFMRERKQKTHKAKLNHSDTGRCETLHSFNPLFQKRLLNIASFRRGCRPEWHPVSGDTQLLKATLLWNAVIFSITKDQKNALFRR